MKAELYPAVGVGGEEIRGELRNILNDERPQKAKAHDSLALRGALERIYPDVECAEGALCAFKELLPEPG